MKKIKSIILRYNFLLNFSYFIIWLRCRYIYYISLLRVFDYRDNTCVIFQSYKGKYACSPKYLYESMLKDEEFADFSFIWIVENYRKYQFLLENPRTKIIVFGSKEYVKAFKKSKYWIINSMLPLSVVKRKGQICLQCWHGTPVKKLRQDISLSMQGNAKTKHGIVQKNYLDTLRYDFFISQSKFATQKFVSAFGIKNLNDKGKILEFGYPRNDKLVDSRGTNSAYYKNKLGLPLDKKILLYAPTWRDGAGGGQLGLDLDKFISEVSQECVLAFKSHYFINSSIDFSEYKNFVYDFQDLDDINELFIASDILITDYSSIIFDYAILNKPVLLYAYDLDLYENYIRGLYDEYRNLPFEIYESQGRITEKINEIICNKSNTPIYLEDFYNKFLSLEDGLASDRVLNLMKNLVQI